MYFCVMISSSGFATVASDGRAAVPSALKYELMREMVESCSAG